MSDENNRINDEAAEKTDGARNRAHIEETKEDVVPARYRVIGNG